MSELDDQQRLDALIRITGYEPGDPALFHAALTHGSHGGPRSNRRSGGDYQRLEFLGDRVLGLVMADNLFAAFPTESEGQLSARLNALVTREMCAEIARASGIAPLIRLGKQARDDGARESSNVLGDVVEAVIGALFLDGGLAAARSFIDAAWGKRIEMDAVAPKHPKSALLEWSAANKRKPPVYTLLRRSGPDHAPQFTVSAAVPNAGEAEATGSSKQEAEAAAAAALLGQLMEARP